MSPNTVAVIEVAAVAKRYGGVQALQNASLRLMPGEVHMLMGENGAGKSTLTGTLIGTVRPDEGTLRIRGELVKDHTPARARAEGINVVLQDFSLAPSLKVHESLFLGRELTVCGFRQVSEMRRQASAVFDELGVCMDIDSTVRQLTRGEQQVVEIANAMLGKSGALLLDEPTAAISHEESEKLFAVVQRLREQGWAILYITHRMEEMRRLGDVVTVLRDGVVIDHQRLDAVTDEQVIAAMVGRELTSLYPHIHCNPGEVALEIRGLCTPDNKVVNASARFRFGEVVGLGGLVGSGKSEMMRACFGLLPCTGSIMLEGYAAEHPSPRAMLMRGMVYLSQDRRGEALALSRTVEENMALELLDDPAYAPLGWLRKGKIRQRVTELAQSLALRPMRLTARVEEFSGGNQQKVVLGRALTRPRRVYVFDEPTSGVDVGARQEIYGYLKSLCEAGAAVVLISSDLQELINLSHRVYVLNAGRVAAELSGSELCETRVVGASFGQTQASGGQPARTSKEPV